jgi:hypothetical protein
MRPRISCGRCWRPARGADHSRKHRARSPSVALSLVPMIFVAFSVPVTVPAQTMDGCGDSWTPLLGSAAADGIMHDAPVSAYADKLSLSGLTSPADFSSILAACHSFMGIMNLGRRRQNQERVADVALPLRESTYSTARPVVSAHKDIHKPT